MTQIAYVFAESALQELFEVPSDDFGRIVERLERLHTEPEWQAKHVKKMKGRDSTYRLRVGDWRVFFTRDGDIAVQGIRRRQDTTYSATRQIPTDDGGGASTTRTLDQLREAFGGTDTPLSDDELLDEELARGAQPVDGELLPRSLDADKLRRWHVPSEFHDALIACRTADDLLDLEMDHRVVRRVLDMLLPGDVETAMAGPQYVVHGERELRRWVEGEISQLLLRLDPEQEALVDIQLDGPTLVRGGAGTGKTVIAIHRALALAARRPKQRILFATFTNALTRYAEDLLRHLFDERKIDAELTVATVDHLVRQHAPTPHQMIGGKEARKVVEGLLEHETDPQLRRLGARYLFEEFEQVIDAHGIEDRNEYLRMERRGRRLLLVHEERTKVWRVYTAWRAKLHSEGRITWSQLRTLALGRANPAYDVILVDEAQDLTPVALQFLVALSRDRRSIHITADAAQSLYPSGFTWRGVDEALDMRGRSHVLRRDHRTTREIHAAARHLAELLEFDTADLPEPSSRTGMRPRIVPTDSENPYAGLPGLLREMCREARLPLGAAAVLAPRTKIVEEILFKLNEAGIQAEHGRDGPDGVDSPAVKVLPIQSAKGLEYPVVVVFGVDDGVLPRIVADLPQEEQKAHRARDARTMFVACTRAMRALAVVHTTGHPSPFLHELGAPEWAHPSSGPDPDEGTTAIQG